MQATMEKARQTESERLKGRAKVSSALFITSVRAVPKEIPFKVKDQVKLETLGGLSGERLAARRNFVTKHY